MKIALQRTATTPHFSFLVLWGERRRGPWTVCLWISLGAWIGNRWYACRDEWNRLIVGIGPFDMTW